MFCAHCGKEIDDNAVICPGCGVPTAGNPSPETTTGGEDPKTAKMAMVFAFLIPIVGIVFSIIGLHKYTDPKLKKQCIYAIIIAVVSQIL